MNSKLTLRSFTLVTALVAAASSMQLAAVPDQPEAAPSRGTVFIYTDRAWKVDNVDGRLIVFRTPIGTLPQYAALFDEPRAGLRYDTAEIDKLFPLSVGKAVDFPIYVQDPRQWNTTVRVTANERLRISAGEFDTFRIEITQQMRPWTDGKILKTTKWYAPALGTIVKAEFPSDPSFELFAVDNPADNRTGKFDGSWSGTLTTTENRSGQCFASPVPVAFKIENGRPKDFEMDGTPKSYKFYGSLSESGELRGAWISIAKDNYVMSFVDGVVSESTITLRFANKSCVSQQVLKRN